MNVREEFFMPYAAESYIHEMDRKAFAALNTFPRFVKLVEAYHANYDEKAARIQLLSSAVRISENQMPEIYRLLPPIARNSGLRCRSCITSGIRK